MKIKELKELLANLDPKCDDYEVGVSTLDGYVKLENEVESIVAGQVVLNGES